MSLSLCVCVCVRACVHVDLCVPAPMVEAYHWLKAKLLSLLAGSLPWGLLLLCRVQRSCQFSLSSSVAKERLLV